MYLILDSFLYAQFLHFFVRSPLATLSRWQDGKELFSVRWCGANVNMKKIWNTKVKLVPSGQSINLNEAQLDRFHSHFKHKNHKIESIKRVKKRQKNEKPTAWPVSWPKLSLKVLNFISFKASRLSSLRLMTLWKHETERDACFGMKSSQWWWWSHASMCRYFIHDK